MIKFLSLLVKQIQGDIRVKLKEYLLACSSGIILSLSFPKINLEFFAFLGFLPLLFALKGKSLSESFRLSYFCGFIFNLIIFYWVMIVMQQYGKLPWPLALIILLLLATYLGLYFTLTFSTACFLERKGLKLTITLPFLWVSFEYLKSSLFTGFPWENLGYSQFLLTYMIQVADITGVYGVSFLIVIFNTFLFSLITSWKTLKKIPKFETLLILFLFFIVFCYSYLRIENIKKVMGDRETITVKLIQPNIDQAVKWNPEYQEETLRILESLTLTPRDDHSELIIWPEAAVPFYYQLNGDKAVRVQEILGKSHASCLLFGSPAISIEGSEIKYYNSAFLISSEGKILGRYDKIHLVPFGEYVPLKKILFFVQKMVKDIGDFSSGKESGVLSCEDKKLGVLICYEIIFPELARRCIQKGASLLITITNDAWFGRTSAPYQHNSMAVFRAIENRVFVLRCANTGISSIIDPSGKIISSTKIFTPAKITGKIKLLKFPTIYKKYGDIFAILCIIISGLFFGKRNFEKVFLKCKRRFHA